MYYFLAINDLKKKRKKKALQSPAVSDAFDNMRVTRTEWGLNRRTSLSYVINVITVPRTVRAGYGLRKHDLDRTNRRTEDASDAVEGTTDGGIHSTASQQNNVADSIAGDCWSITVGHRGSTLGSNGQTTT